MEDSDRPITVSEIPPQGQSSGLSYAQRLNERSLSGISENSSKSRTSKKESSPTAIRSFKQSFIEKWITVTSSQPKSAMGDEEDKIPPWASASRPLTLEDGFSVNSISHPIREESEEEERVFNPLNDANSEYSLPVIDDKLPDDESGSKGKAVDSLTLDQDLGLEGFSVMARGYISPTSDEDVYATPRLNFSPERSIHYNPYIETQPYNQNVDTQPYNQNADTQPYNQDIDTQSYRPDQETQPYNKDADTQPYRPYNRNVETEPCLLEQETQPYDDKETQPYDDKETQPYNDRETLEVISTQADNKIETISPLNQSNSDQVETPSDRYSSSQETAPYDYLQETLSEDCSADVQSESEHTANESLPPVGNEQQVEIPKMVQDPTNRNETSIPFTLPSAAIADDVSSPIADLAAEKESISSSTSCNNQEQFNDLREENAAIISGKRRLSQDNTNNLSVDQGVQPVKIQKLNEKKLSGSNEASSSSAAACIKLVRPDKKQIRSSVLKKPVTIENYFLFPSDSNQPGEEERGIGRDSATPSSCSKSIEDPKKNDEESSSESIDERRKPRFGISKRGQR